MRDVAALVSGDFDRRGAMWLCDPRSPLQQPAASDQCSGLSRTGYHGGKSMNAHAAAGQLDDYFEEAKAWDCDRTDAMRREIRTAWRVAIAAVICALSVSTALMFAMPLKRVDPYLIRVDGSTGVVDVVPVFAGQAPLDEAVTRYFLSHYVGVCERFNFSTAESDYEECGAFHSPQRNQSWYAQWNRSNPRSPLNVHRDGSTIATQVAAVSFFRRVNGVSDTAQVRYLKIERAAVDSPARVSHWIATVQYTYAAPPSDPRMRRWNPIGFRVLEFVSEPEVMNEGADSAPPSGAVGKP
jgi:type IV secretion system protein VirB8